MLESFYRQTADKAAQYVRHASSNFAQSCLRNAPQSPMLLYRLCLAKYYHSRPYLMMSLVLLLYPPSNMNFRQTPHTL